MKREDIIWIIIGCLSCLGIGIFMAFSLQYFYYNSLALIHWDIILKGGFMLGCLLIVCMFAFVFAEAKSMEDGETLS